jgi:O-antigen ligase
VHPGLISLLIASTMNGLSAEWAVFGREITVRPDQVVLVFLLPVLALAYGLGRFRLHLNRFEWVVLAFLFTNFASSMLISPSQRASLQGAALLGACVAMYFVTREIVSNRAEWLGGATNWVVCLGIAQALYCLTALILYYFGYVIGGLQIGHLSEASVAIEGTFWEANLLGAYLALIALFFTVRYVLAPEGQRGGTYLLGLFITSLALPLTVTRSAALALALGMLATALIVCAYHREIHGWRRKAGRIVVVLGCVLLLTVTVMNALVSTISRYPNLLLERWIPISLAPAIEVDVPTTGGAVTQASRGSMEGRLDAWLRAMEFWREHPIFGHGTLAGGNVIREGWWYSSLVQALYDTGLLGFLVLLWIHVGAVVYPVRAWLRTRRNPMSANLLGFGLGNAVLFFTSQFSNLYFVGFPWVFLGLSMGAVAAYSKGHVANGDWTSRPAFHQG